MLTGLKLSQCASFGEIELDFFPGFGALTGETGAGKSILIEALGLCLGARAEAHFVPKGAQRSEISALFSLSESSAYSLMALGIECPDLELSLRRAIFPDGKSKAYANGSAISIGEMRRAGALLARVYGQHESLDLFAPERQRQLADSRHAAIHSAFALAWKNLTEAHSALESARNQREALEKERHALLWERSEISALNPKEGEWQALCANHTLLSSSAELLAFCDSAEELLTGSASSLASSLGTLLRSGKKLLPTDPALSGPLSSIDQALLCAQEASRDIAARRAKLQMEPDDLAQTESRMSAFWDLARKIRSKPDLLGARSLELDAQIERFGSLLDEKALEEALAKAQAQAQSAARELSKARTGATASIEKKANGFLKDLGMDKARLFFESTPQQTLQSFGAERLELRYQSHPAAPALPFSNSASGGEISRCALALLLASPDDLLPDTLIFDEIDTGVSGQAALKMGTFLRKACSGPTRRQALAVTHLPAVAACAERHYLASKETRKGKPVSSARALAPNERAAEISNLMTGSSSEASSLKSAQELLRKCQNI